MRCAALALLLAAAAGGAGAEPPAVAPIPMTRPGTPPPGAAPEALAVEPPARPGSALALTVRPDGEAPAAPDEPAVAGPAVAPDAEPPPAPARAAPAMREGAGAALGGLAGVVRAELFMGPPAPVPVALGGWTGDGPPVRPAPEPAPAALPASGRPRARPAPPADPAPLLPPEPDAPPAYRPGARPDILPLSPEYSVLAVAAAVLPARRPDDIADRAAAAEAEAARARAEAARGSVCGDVLIQGEVAAPVRGGGGCGIEEPVRVRSVDGIALSEPALMDCQTAEALLAWVQRGARPAVGGRGDGLARLDVMGHYACRPRNNQAGARLSEHGRGRAVDIGGVTLADGSTIVVARDWPDPVLRAMREAACGPFTTVLGPGSDRFHSDHLHLDTARGRGAYCR